MLGYRMIQQNLKPLILEMHSSHIFLQRGLEGRLEIRWCTTIPEATDPLAAYSVK
jgi:hypothetical protein